MRMKKNDRHVPFRKPDNTWKTCLGTTLAEEFQRAQEKELFEKRMKDACETYISSKAEIIGQPFYFIAFKYALKDDHGNYYPCEVGLVKYALNCGVQKSLHYFINPGNYPLGSKGAAKKHSEKHHKIPYLGFPLATDKYADVFGHIRDILLEENGSELPYPPLFCMPDELEITRRCLRFLFEKAQRPVLESVTLIGSITTLIQKLHCGDEFCDEATALEIVSRPQFDYLPGVVCDWHYEMDCICCALGTARKMAFNISQAMVAAQGISLSPNHLPTVGGHSLAGCQISCASFGPHPSENVSQNGYGRGRGVTVVSSNCQPGFKELYSKSEEGNRRGSNSFGGMGRGMLFFKKNG